MTETTDRTILVTGASSGIGHAIATLLLKRGCRVIGLARDFSKATFDSDNFVAVSIDLSRLDELAARLETLIQDEPAIDGVILCAGSGRFGSLEEFSHTQIRALIELNLTSPIYLARTLIPGMKQRASGDIVFMGVSIVNPGMVKTAFFDELDFQPGDAPDNYILPEDVARAVLAILETRTGTVFDEINLSPQKKVIRFPKPGER